MSKPRTRGDLDSQRCAFCSEGAHEHGDEGPMVLVPRCHPDYGVRARYASGVLSLSCGCCDKLVVSVYVAESAPIRKDLH